METISECTVERVTAHTEFGPACELREQVLSRSSATWYASRNAGEGDTCEIGVHELYIDAQLPVENPILEHESFRVGQSLAAVLELPSEILPEPKSGILCLYQHKEWWMRPIWVHSLADVPARTQMIMWRSRGGTWCVLLAVCDGEMRADLCAGESASQISASLSVNQASRTVIRGLALVSAAGNDPYALVDACVQAIAQRNGLAMHESRPFPEALRGLGWCTWDSLGQQVSELAIFEKMREFQAKQVPVSWVLIDDGWSETANGKLTGLRANEQRFPHGLAHTIRTLKTEFGVRHVGVWQAFQGYWQGVEPESTAARELDGTLEHLPNSMLIPCADQSRSAEFWHVWDTQLQVAGIDFVKVDSQSTTSLLARGVESFGSLRERHAALDSVTGQLFDGALINCMGMAPESYWSRPSSPIARTSDDFFPSTPESLAEHAIENAYCSLLIGCLCYCDWDMFWTRHPHARTHMLLRWISGGPIYCSDKLGETDPDLLAPLFDADGNLTHPDGVGVPVLDSLLADPVRGDVPLGIRNTFRGDEVLLFVGLNADAPQTAHIRATESALAVLDPETGARIRLEPSDELAITLNYGDCALRVLQRL